MTKTFLIQCRGRASFIRPLNMVVGAKVVERLLCFSGSTSEDQLLNESYAAIMIVQGGVWQLRRPLILVR